MDWQIFFNTFFATGFAAGAFVFLAKALSKHFLSLDFERFKGELKATHERELERLRADLRIAAFRQETTFAKLHEKRAEVIAELYAKLVTVNAAMKDLLHPLELDGGAARDQKEKAAADAGNDFGRYYSRHLIYFDENLCSLLHSFNRDMIGSWVVHRHNPITGEGGIDGWEPRTKAWEHLNKQVTTIQTEIEQNFRQLLGFPPPTQPPTKSE